MKKIIIANWKMAPTSIKEANKLFDSILKYDLKGLKINLVIAPPFIYLPFLSLGNNKESAIKFAAQDVFWENPPSGGAFTGEISVKMLKSLGAEYVIIGHSERRKYTGETDEAINKKIKTALNGGLKAVLCVGEPKRESGIRNKESGMKKAKEYVKNQLKKDLKNIHNSKFKIHDSLIIAYEPIWAIGTGIAAHPQDVLEMIKYIKQLIVNSYKLRVKVLYGGSVDSKNIQGFLKHNEIDGALVGSASTKAAEFKKIVEITNKLNYEQR